MSGLLLLCTELTFFCAELPENCIYLNQSELSNFSMYIIRGKRRFELGGSLIHYATYKCKFLRLNSVRSHILHFCNCRVAYTNDFF